MKIRIISCLVALVVLITLPIQALASSALIVNSHGDSKKDGDCIVVADRLGYSSITKRGFGGSANPTLNTFKAADGYNVLYWSGHGVSSGNSGLALPDNQDSFKATKVATSDWTENSLRVAVFASCWTLDSTPRTVWTQVMRDTNLRVVAGYHEKAPGSSSTEDVAIAKKFFNYLENYKNGSARYAWKKANGSGQAWCVLVYHKEGTEMLNYPMPGFGTYSGPTPTSSTPIYRYSNAKPNGTLQKSSAIAPNINSLPYEIEVSPSILSLNLSVLGRGKISTTQDSQTNAIREDRMVPMGESEVISQAKDALKSLGLAANMLKNAEISPNLLAIAEVTESGEGPEMIVGGDVEFTQTFNGVPIHNNSVTIGIDALGVFEVTNQLKTVFASDTPARSAQSYLSPNSAASNAVAANGGGRAKKTSHVYADNGSGSYVLSYLVELEDGTEYTVDCRTGSAIKD